MLLSVFLWQSPQKPLYKTANRFSLFIQSNADGFGWYVRASETQPWTLSPRLCRIVPSPESYRWCLDFHLCTFAHTTLSNCKIFHTSLYPCQLYPSLQHSLGPTLPMRPPWVAHSTFPSLNSSSVPFRTSSFVARSVCINSLCLHTPSL